MINLELTEPNPPTKEGYQYGYAMFEWLPDIYVDSSKHKTVQPLDVSSINATSDTVTKREQ